MSPNRSMIPEYYRPSTDSTMDLARRLVGASTFFARLPAFVVRTGHQYGGRGRRGARWVDRTGGSILATLVYAYPAGTPSRDMTLPLRIGLGACRGIERACRDSGARLPQLRIKWPNDILVNDQKLVGILVESDAHRAFVGIGINLLPVGTIPDGLPSASLYDLWSGDASMRTALPTLRIWRTIVEEIEEARTSENWHEPISSRLAWRGRTVVVQNGADPPSVVVRGMIEGVDRSGALLMQTERGIVPIISGSIRPDQ